MKIVHAVVFLRVLYYSAGSHLEKSEDYLDTVVLEITPLIIDVKHVTMNGYTVSLSSLDSIEFVKFVPMVRIDRVSGLVGGSSSIQATLQNNATSLFRVQCL
jgi:hypothetical protein